MRKLTTGTMLDLELSIYDAMSKVEGYKAVRQQAIKNLITEIEDGKIYAVLANKKDAVLAKLKEEIS